MKKLIPCLICEEESEAINPLAIAKICRKCDNADEGVFVKSIDYKKVINILDQKQVRLTEEGELI